MYKISHDSTVICRLAFDFTWSTTRNEKGTARTIQNEESRVECVIFNFHEMLDEIQDTEEMVENETEVMLSHLKTIT